jgi:hypothetical protein
MALPRWTRNGDTFWKRHYDITLAEQVSEEVEKRLAEWLEQAERDHGKAAEEPE